MKTFKIIIFSALLLFHIAAIVIISIGKNDLNFLFDLFKQMHLVQYGAIVGLILFAIVIVLFQMKERTIKRMTEKHNQEINEIKAKLYDKRESEEKQKGSSDDQKDTKEATSKQQEGDKTKPED